MENDEAWSLAAHGISEVGNKRGGEGGVGHDQLHNPYFSTLNTLG